MTLNQLLYFYQAASLEHFNLAAKALHISEPSSADRFAFLKKSWVYSYSKKKEEILF